MELEVCKPAMLLQARRISKSFGANRILDGVSLSLGSGESLLVQGPSGCGKTTLLRCLALLEELDSGEIIFDNKVISRPDYRLRPSHPLRLQVAMVFQNLYLWNHLSVVDNVALPLRLTDSMSREDAETKARTLLREFGIDEKARCFPPSLSTGQQQRVAIARAIVHSPRLLLLDEITANLDSQTASRVLESVEKLLESDSAIVIVSHSSEIPGTLRQSILRLDPLDQRGAEESEQAAILKGTPNMSEVTKNGNSA